MLFRSINQSFSQKNLELIEIIRIFAPNNYHTRIFINLRSLNFSVKYADGSFVFTVLGYGHGVGMSQYGANYMAKQGSDFKEILTYYYTDCKVERL